MNMMRKKKHPMNIQRYSDVPRPSYKQPRDIYAYYCLFAEAALRLLCWLVLIPSRAPRKVSTAVIVPTTWSPYGSPQMVAIVKYRVPIAGKAINAIHLRISYCLFVNFILTFSFL